MSAAPPYDEKMLLQQMADGSEAAFRAIFEKYWDKIYSSALLLTKSPELAEDIAQDVFAQIWARRSQMPIIEKLDNYLFILARNLIYDRFRKESYNKKYRHYIIQYFSEETNNIAELAEFKEAGAILLEGINKMPPQQQKAFRLSRFDGLNHREIAEKMQLSQPTVKNYIVKSIAFLRKYLDEHSVTLITVGCFIYFLIKK